MRKVCVFIGSRANYSSIKSVMRAVQAHPDLTLQLVVGASALLDRFGSVVDVIEADGFTPDARVTMIVEGETPATMAKSTGLGLLELPTMFELLKPDVVVSVGDRFETMATAIAAAYMNIPVAHTMGGEISGTIDESIRHAVTKLAHLHFPANQAAAERIIRMGEPPGTRARRRLPAHRSGQRDCRAAPTACRTPSGWTARAWARTSTSAKPFLLVNQHPVTTEYGQGKDQIWETLHGARRAADADHHAVAQRGRRAPRTSRPACGRSARSIGPEYIRFYKNFPIETYVRLMLLCACAVGNSSAPIREGAFLGVPAVNIGTRQTGRDRGPNVVDVPYARAAIVDGIRRQLAHGRYPADRALRRRPGRRPRIADVLAARAAVGAEAAVVHAV